MFCQPIKTKTSQILRTIAQLVFFLRSLGKMYVDQMYENFDQIFSKHQCSFPQGYNTQQCLLVMVEKWKETLDKGVLGGLLLTDLSKTFGCIKHDLLIAKLTT